MQVDHDVYTTMQRDLVELTLRCAHYEERLNTQAAKYEPAEVGSAHAVMGGGGGTGSNPKNPGYNDKISGGGAVSFNVFQLVRGERDAAQANIRKLKNELALMRQQRDEIEFAHNDVKRELVHVMKNGKDEGDAEKQRARANALQSRIEGVVNFIGDRYKAFPNRDDESQIITNRLLQQLAYAAKIRLNVPTQPPVVVEMEPLP